MTKIDRERVNVAILAHPFAAPNEVGGTQAFSGLLGNSLQDRGFAVTIYGYDKPQYPFRRGIEYVATGPTASDMVKSDNLSKTRASNQSRMRAPLYLARDIRESRRASLDTRWVVIDNDMLSVQQAPFLEMLKIPHIFIQHSEMSTERHKIFRDVSEAGGKIVAIADHQREQVTHDFGSIHDTTIKVGVSVDHAARPRQLVQGEPIQIGTLCRIKTGDDKGIGFALRAVERLNARRPAFLSIAGDFQGSGLREALIAPYEEKGYAQYVGEKRGQEKVVYLSNLHLGAAISNPGEWNEQDRTFGGTHAEQNSATLAEMLFYGAVPITTDSGGAEAVKDAGLENLIVPLDLLVREGSDPFIDLVAQKMEEAAYQRTNASLEQQRSRVTTVDNMGEQYATYIDELLQQAA